MRKSRLIPLSAIAALCLSFSSCSQQDPSEFQGWWKFTSMRTDANTTLTGKDTNLYMEISREGDGDLFRVCSFVFNDATKMGQPLDTSYFTLTGNKLECGVESDMGGKLYRSRTVYSLSSKTRLKGRADVTVGGVKNKENSSTVEFSKVQNPGIR